MNGNSEVTEENEYETDNYCQPLLGNIFITRAPSNLRREHPRTRAFSYACSFPVM